MACIHCKRADKYLKTHFHVGGLLYWIIALHCCCSWGGNTIRHHAASDHYNAGRKIMKTSRVEESMLLSFTYCCWSSLPLLNSLFLEHVFTWKALLDQTKLNIVQYADPIIQISLEGLQAAVKGFSSSLLLLPSNWYKWKTASDQLSSWEWGHATFLRRLNTCANCPPCLQNYYGYRWRHLCCYAITAMTGSEV